VQKARLQSRAIPFESVKRLVQHGLPGFARVGNPHLLKWAINTVDRDHTIVSTVVAIPVLPPNLKGTKVRQ
jgi:hypothetical protein